MTAPASSAPGPGSGTKVVIVGGVAGGATAAARIRRLDEQARITVFERSGYISYANCGLPYYTLRVRSTPQKGTTVTMRKRISTRLGERK